MRKIRSADLKSVKDLASPHPVFLLEFGTQDPPGSDSRLVVKAEWRKAGSATRYDAIAQIMAQIGRNTPSERLAGDEANQLRHAPKTTELMQKWFALEAGVFWVKMPYQERLVDLIGLRGHVSFSEEQKETIKNVMIQLTNNQRAWESLGEIIAADYFLGNGDRISRDENGKAMLQNPGNIFFKFNKKGQLKKALALDNFDPWGTPTHDVDIEQWKRDFAPVLKYRGLAAEFAGGVVDSINRHAAEAGVYLDLNNNERWFFLRGFERGIEKLKVYVQSKKANLPPGIVNRSTNLGWL